MARSKKRAAIVPPDYPGVAYMEVNELSNKDPREIVFVLQSFVWWRCLIFPRSSEELPGTMHIPFGFPKRQALLDEGV